MYYKRTIEVSASRSGYPPGIISSSQDNACILFVTSIFCAGVFLICTASHADAQENSRVNRSHVAAHTAAASRHAQSDKPKAATRTQAESISVVGASRLHAARARLRSVPGNTAVISAKDVERGRAANLEDTLAFQPGIYAQATSGSTGNKISIRGSGAGVFYGGYALGMKYLIDGMAISGVGGLQEDRLSTIGYQMTEVLYGANAFDYASTSLGGAINFISASGVSNPGFTARWEGGSYGTANEQLSQGGTFDHHKGDYYITVARADRQGFQNYTRTDRTDVDFNLGYRFTDKFSARIIGRWDEGSSYYGGVLTLAQIRQNPSQNPNDWGKRPTDSGMLGIKSLYQIDDKSELEYGITLNRYELANNEGTTQPQLWRSTDVNNSIRYTRNDKLFGKPSKTTMILSNVQMVSGDSRYFNTSVPAYQSNRADWTMNEHTKFQGSHDSVLSVGNNTEILNHLWLTTGLSAIWIQRKVAISDRAIPNSSVQSSENYNAIFLAPRIGMRYEINKNIDLYTNLSRSIDPPVTWEYQNPNGGSGYKSTAAVGRVEAQRAYTVEVGLRGHVGPFQGSFTAYRSWVHDELLSVVVQRATTTTAEVDSVNNASPTIHQGLELGLDTTLLHSNNFGKVTFRQAASVNDFHYVSDPTFGRNQLPGLPRWVYQAALQWEHRTGFYANVNYRATSSYYADYANTLKAPSYGIWGLKVGYEAPSKRWSAFVDVRNLANKHYVTATYTEYNLKGIDTAAFYPGDGFSMFGGLMLHL
ncbi:TonB-dependent receptor [Acetobacter oeni]|nr:TonB-dependent receptor [Acetobacter oeni]